MAKIKYISTICHECKGTGDIGSYHYGDFLPSRKCSKCNGTGKILKR